MQTINRIYTKDFDDMKKYFPQDKIIAVLIILAAISQFFISTFQYLIQDLDQEKIEKLILVNNAELSYINNISLSNLALQNYTACVDNNLKNLSCKTAFDGYKLHLQNIPALEQSIENKFKEYNELLSKNGKKYKNINISIFVFNFFFIFFNVFAIMLSIFGFKKNNK